MKSFPGAIILSAISFIIWTCGPGSTPPSLPQTTSQPLKPQWLVEYPVTPNYYVGIGSALKTQYGAEAQKSAQDMALADLASQISVSITSDIVTSLIEKGDITEEEYKASARSQAIADLEGHELIDSWQDQDYYYAYYRLSKAKYAAIQARKRQAALDLSVDFLKQAETAAAINNFSDAFSAGLQAFRPLIPYLNEALQANFNGHTVIISNTVNQFLHTLITEINLVPSKTHIVGKLGQPVNEKMQIYAKGEGGQAIRNLPLSAHFTKGGGELTKTLSTGKQGYAELKVLAITSNMKLQAIEISIDLESMYVNEADPILSSIINSIPKGSTQIILDVKNPTIYLETTEVYRGRQLSQLQIEPKVKNHLIKQGFHFVDKPGQADWQMTLNATATRGTEFSGMYTVFADVNLSVIDRNTGAEIYKNSLSRVKGIDLNYQNAANKALRTAAEKLNETILPQILESLK